MGDAAGGGRGEGWVLDIEEAVWPCPGLGLLSVSCEGCVGMPCCLACVAYRVTYDAVLLLCGVGCGHAVFFLSWWRPLLWLVCCVSMPCSGRGVPWWVYTNDGTRSVRF